MHVSDATVSVSGVRYKTVHPIISCRGECHDRHNTADNSSQKAQCIEGGGINLVSMAIVRL